ncbi:MULTISPECIES: hypothetical protein [unclassified Burkholderia]|nr:MULTISPECIES: hypothetical protein [unclassified Burkholderia]
MNDMPLIWHGAFWLLIDAAPTWVAKVAVFAIWMGLALIRGPNPA